MDHAYFKDKISAYFDGALEAQERELIRRHLEECSECRELLEKFQKFSSMVEEKSGLAGDEYFEQLAQKIESRIGAPEEKVVDVRELRWRSFWWKTAAAAASVLLVATVVFYQLRDDSDMPSRMLKDFDSAKEPSAVVQDSIFARENFEGGRADADKPARVKIAEGKEIAGNTIVAEASRKKRDLTAAKEKASDDRQEVAADEFESDRESNLPSSVGQVSSAPKPATLSNEKQPEKELSEGKAEAQVPEEHRPPVDSLQMKQNVRVVEERPTVERFGVVNTDKITQNTLADWRSQRDSIQTVLGFEQDTVQNLAKNQLKSLAAPKASSFADNQTKDTTIVYQQLANSWYQIAIQTPDSTERNRAILFLNWYKGQFPADSPTVNLQIQQIPR